MIDIIIISCLTFPFIIWFLFMLTVIKNGNRFDKMVFITRFSKNEILDHMNEHNRRDILSYEFYLDKTIQNFVFSVNEINKDWYYKEGKVLYEFIMKSYEEGTEISLYVVERTSPLAQIRYGYVMKEFFFKKLDASLPYPFNHM